MIKAIIPATQGVANEVPDQTSYLLLGTATLTSSPGTTKSIYKPLLDHEQILFALLVAPTVIAVSNLAGE